MPSDSPNPNNTTPSVVEKVLVDIDPKGGVDESTSELAVDWTKRWLQAENFVVDGSVMRPRPGQTAITEGTTETPVFRLAALDDGLGSVASTDYHLYHHNEATGTTGTAAGFSDKGNLPEFAVRTRKFGADQGTPINFSGIAGVLGVANLTYYDAIAYVSNQTYGGGVCIEVMDKKSNNIVMRWIWFNTKMLVMVGVDGRYLHFYCPGLTSPTEGGPDVGPFCFVIDTQNPPANGNISTISRTYLTVAGTGNGWEIGAVTPISGGSVVVVNRHTSNIHDGNCHMEQFNNTAPAPTSVRNIDITNFFYVTGIDVDTAGNLYLAGYKNPPIDPAILNLTGWWRGSYAGTPWNPTASAGVSGTNGTLSNAGTAFSVGTALNGFTSCDNNAVAAAQMTSTNVQSSYILAAGFSVAMLVNMDTAPADDSTNPYKNAQIIGDNAVAGSTNWGITYSTAGIVAWVRDGATFKRVAVPMAVGGWHLVKVVWDGAAKVLKCSLDAVSLGTGVSTSTLWTINAVAMRMGQTVSSVATLDGKVVEIMTTKLIWADADFDLVRDYMNGRYGLSL